ncbi:RsmB/NOP family class I SAM-dependent RNA methyltransferase [Hyperthermus butylicus]|uniref:Ribosomal RNA small subunit methyltransferase B n=1 Tax=Hyperthermus butylicus (strain DSM 5456 / JCM 9403 / PLM1-5) TaxID=415426 RepID=A2BKV5_HYPBU|nr:RsmB/NOP family class I SAM-dependent RNA methyltransferase [Hyperthermus butylicus]ABM80616.1 ribosomal RNA small subunit methyltransferase B [Hyperthermus butylicus DSM 5456]
MVLPEEVAARILAETVRRRASLRDVAVGFFSRNPELDYMKPIVRVLTLGVARHYLLLDRVLVSLGYGPPSHSQRWMLARVLVYEALSGKLKPTRARKLAEKAGLDPDKLLELRGADPREFVKGLSGLDRLSVLYSFPRWMLEELLEARIPDLPKLLEVLNSDPVRWIRIRPGVDRKWLAERLQEQGVVIEPDKDLPDVARIVKGASEATRTREYQEGLYTIQDKASTLVGWVASPRGRVAADPTAGAAIKASHMAWLGARYVVAGDVKPQRLQEAKRTLSRLGLGHIVDLAVGDARMPYWRKLDVVIVDPPCTDIGRLQYEPEVKLWLTRGDLHYYRRLQLRILASVAKSLPRGATIVYSVCTLTRSETVWVLRRLLETHPDVEIVEPEPVLGERPQGLPKAQRMLPHLHKTQGFFIAKLAKIA